jgi:hypothetical protein
VTPETCRAEKQRKIKNIELLHLVGILFIKSRCTDKRNSNKICILISSTNFVILGRIRRHIVIKVHTSVFMSITHCYYYQILMKLKFFDIFSKIKISNFIKIRSLGADLFRADSRRSDRYDEANRRVPQFYKRTKEKLGACQCRILWQRVCFRPLNSKLYLKTCIIIYCVPRRKHIPSRL